MDIYHHQIGILGGSVHLSIELRIVGGDHAVVVFASGKMLRHHIGKGHKADLHIPRLENLIGTGGSDILSGAGIGKCPTCQRQKGMLNALPSHSLPHDRWPR